MQNLTFESAWSKTISNKDRKQIERAFSDAVFDTVNSIYLSPLWQAINHKNHLLITVLIHNTTQQDLSFHNTKMRYIEGNQIVAEHSFTIPSLVIEPQTSMPWTFIFPVDSMRIRAALKNGKLEIVDSE
ncbi:SLAP domain-containing protein [Virgibacillus oceani]|uniref:SLAP domain-containing protein n=1 Tax=Virgibacillus oceani TaxID=1479511 RepID=A0A917HCT0_9BACI|nr:SLAP domain-containing protein [Virgibacillus oceani]GGG74422.1 hypothetical protein GCM10011398_18860 [Virgibacillus oceani]